MNDAPELNRIEVLALLKMEAERLAPDPDRLALWASKLKRLNELENLAPRVVA